MAMWDGQNRQLEGERSTLGMHVSSKCKTACSVQVDCMDTSCGQKEKKDEPLLFCFLHGQQHGAGLLPCHPHDRMAGGQRQGHGGRGQRRCHASQSLETRTMRRSTLAFVAFASLFFLGGLYLCAGTKYEDAEGDLSELMVTHTHTHTHTQKQGE